MAIPPLICGAKASSLMSSVMETSCSFIQVSAMLLFEFAGVPNATMRMSTSVEDEEGEYEGSVLAFACSLSPDFISRLVSNSPIAVLSAPPS
eukprot:12926994-Prorocentrum_lima.AAC.1